MHMPKKENLRFPHSPIHLLYILILTLFILTHCEKQHEIAACIIHVWSFTEVLPKIKTTTTKKKNLVPKTTSLFLNKLYPLVTEKVAWHLSYIYIFLSQHTRNMHIGSFFFRPLPFSWHLKRVQRKKFKLGLTTLFNNKIFYKIRLSLSRELQYLPFHFFTVYTPLICPPSLNFCLELSCMLHVLW